MTCANYRNAILDLARGVAMPSSLASTAQAHLEVCAACAAWFRQERDLSAGLHALAMSTREAGPSGDAEERLLAEFDALQAGEAATVRQRSAGRLMKILLPAAAAIALAAWLSGDHARVGAPDETSSRPVLLVSALPAPTPPDLMTVGRMVAPPRSPLAQRPSPPSVPEIRTLEFTPVPGSLALPAFESGHILRVELPVSALPSYGVAIVPEAARTEVSADVLVGQDGLPRGIRIVGRN
jgi:hypothetical protein